MQNGCGIIAPSLAVQEGIHPMPGEQRASSSVMDEEEEEGGVRFNEF